WACPAALTRMRAIISAARTLASRWFGALAGTGTVPFHLYEHRVTDHGTAFAARLHRGIQPRLLSGKGRGPGLRRHLRAAGRRLRQRRGLIPAATGAGG